MATREGVARMLALLHEAFPSRQITEATAGVWLGLFREYDDAVLLGVAKRLALEPARQFFPTPGECMALLNPTPALDVEGIARRIEGLGYHNARSGWVWPRVEEVRDKLGAGIAEAYGAVGGSRLGTGDEISRTIAIRDFGGTLADVVRRDGARALRPAPEPPTLPDGGPVSPVVRQLSERFDATKSQK